jgi:hypothetical protein
MTALVKTPFINLDFGNTDMLTIIVFSHLRWNFVYQRPQHLLSRLAKNYQIVFMEEPVTNAESTFLEQLMPTSNVMVLRPHVTSSTSGFHDDHLPELQGQLANFMADRNITEYLIWFYTPMALPLANDLQPLAVIYDCMDELSGFKNAPRQLLQRENALYQLADLVLTGGPSLYESKRKRHTNVHCFASSVDAGHFKPQFNVVQADHPAQGHIAHPRLGYCGVIDERLDLELISELAESHPDWQLVMVGPVVKISQESLPRRANIHWLGQQNYDDLPQFMSGWDVCLLPFALNEATRFISPTKTLEYMAAERFSVSTRIKDVAEPYGHVVAIADTASEFIHACSALLNESELEKNQRKVLISEIVASTSWDLTVQSIDTLIKNVSKNGRINKASKAPVEIKRSTHQDLIRHDQLSPSTDKPTHLPVKLATDGLKKLAT